MADCPLWSCGVHRIRRYSAGCGGVCRPVVESARLVVESAASCGPVYRPVVESAGLWWSLPACGGVCRPAGESAGLQWSLPAFGGSVRFSPLFNFYLYKYRLCLSIPVTIIWYTLLLEKILFVSKYHKSRFSHLSFQTILRFPRFPTYSIYLFPSEINRSNISVVYQRQASISLRKFRR